MTLSSRSLSLSEPRRLGLWLLLALSPFALAPALRPGLLQTREGFVAAWNAAAPAALANVAAEPELWRGLGGGALLPVQPLLLLGVSAAAAVQWVMIGCLLLGALGVYTWLRHRLGERAAGIAALVYLFLPISLATVYTQGSLGGALLLALIPLALAGLSIHAAQRSILAAAVAVLSLLWIVRIQAGTGIVVLIVLALYALLVERSRTALLIVAASGAAGLAGLIPLWALRSLAQGSYAFAALSDLLGGAASRDAPLQVGATTFGLVAITLWAMAVQGAPESARRLLGFCLIVAAALLALTLPWSAGLWSISLGWLLDAPWNLGVVAAPLLAAAAGGAVALLPELQRPAWLTGIATLIVLASAPWRAPVYTEIVPPSQPVAILGENQIALLEAVVQESGSPEGGDARADLTLTWQVLRPLDFDANLFFQALTTETPPTVVAQLDSPPLADASATTWQPGDLYTATYTLELGAAQAAPLVYYVGLYDWRDGARLPVDGGRDDKLILDGTPAP